MLTKAAETLFEAIQILFEAIQILFEAVRILFEAVQILFEAVRILFEAIQTLFEAIQINYCRRSILLHKGVALLGAASLHEEEIVRHKNARFLYLAYFLCTTLRKMPINAQRNALNRQKYKLLHV